MQYGGRKNGRLEKGSAASTGLAHSSRSQGARQNREVEFTAQILSQDISNHTSYLTMQNINLDMILFKHRFSMSLLSNVISSRRRQGATLPQAQIKGRHIFHCGKAFVQECHKAWLCQISEEKIGQYAAQRAYARGSNMLCEFSAIVTDLQLLPVLGFPEIRGMHDMPISLFESSIELASELLTLLTTCMTHCAWDSTWWSDLMPHCFAKLLAPEWESETLLHFKQIWTSVERLEEMLFPQKPASAMECEKMVSIAGKTKPEIAKYFLYLDGVSHQICREIIAFLKETDYKSVSPSLKQLLTDMFCVPQSTKTWNEDVFRDLRRSFLHIPTNKVSAWSRQKGILGSLQSRTAEKILPVFAEPLQSTKQQFQTLKHKKLLTQAAFSPISNAKRLKQAVEQGRPVDIGLDDQKSGIKVLISLEKLQGKPKKKQRPAALEKTAVESAVVYDTESIFLLPSSKEASYASASAFALLSNPDFQKIIEQKEWDELERSLGAAWQGDLLTSGTVYLSKTLGYVLCLGWHGYACMMWQLQSVSSPDGRTILSFQDNFVSLDFPSIFEQWHFSKLLLINHVLRLIWFLTAQKDRKGSHLHWLPSHDLLSTLKGVRTAAALPQNLPTSLQCHGLCWIVLEEQELARFAIFQRKAKTPETWNRLMWNLELADTAGELRTPVSDGVKIVKSLIQHFAAGHSPSWLFFLFFFETHMNPCD